MLQGLALLTGLASEMGRARLPREQAICQGLWFSGQSLIIELQNLILQQLLSDWHAT
jgi:hypothetical protein